MAGLERAPSARPRADQAAGLPPAPDTRQGVEQPATRIVPTLPLEDLRPLATSDRIEGTIYDEASRPVADAVVQIIDFSYIATSTRAFDRRFEERTHASTVSGVDGRFLFTGLNPGELKILRVSKPGFVMQMKDGVRVPGRRDFTMTPGARVTGRVLDSATQKPVTGVGIKGWYPAATEVTRDGFRWREEVFTNAQGEYVFEGAPSGMVKFMLTHTEYEDFADEQRVRYESANAIDFRIRPALVVEGVVLNDRKGTPVAGLDVGAFDPMPFPLGAPRWKARTDKNGRFRLPGIRSGPVRFDISGRGFTSFQEVRELTEAENFAAGKTGKPLEFRIVPAGRASGRVTSLKGDPVPRARIFVAPMKGIFVMTRDASQHGGSPADGEARSDEKGGYLVDDITNIPHRLVVEATGFALGVSEPIEVGPDEIKEGVNVVLRPAPAIRGVITEEGRGPVGNAVVSVEVPQFGAVMFPPGSELGQKTQRTGASDPGGAYRVELPYGGKVQVRVDHPDYVLTEPLELVLEDSESELTQDFTLKRALGVSGSVTGPDGQPAAGAPVKAWLLPSGTPAGETRTDAAGAYALQRLQAGALYRIGAKIPEANLTAAFRDEVPAGSSGIDFRLGPGGQIVGNVTGPSGSPVTEFQVLVRPVGERFGPRGTEKKKVTTGLTEREETVSDPGGLFRIEKMDPALWSVQILTPRYAPSQPVDVQVAPGAPVSAGTIALLEGGTVAGRISGPANEAAEGVGITLTRFARLPDGNEPRPIPVKPWSGRTDSTGAYSAKGLVPGEYMLRVESPRFVDPPQERLVVRDGDEIEKSFKLRLSASVTVVVKDEVREPVPAAVLIVIDSNQRRIFVQSEGVGGGSTDGNGRVVLKKLPAGEALTFRAARAGFFGPEKTITLPEGESGPVELKLERAH